MLLNTEWATDVAYLNSNSFLVVIAICVRVCLCSCWRLIYNA